MHGSCWIVEPSPSSSSSCFSSSWSWQGDRRAARDRGRQARDVNAMGDDRVRRGHGVGGPGGVGVDLPRRRHRLRPRLPDRGPRRILPARNLTLLAVSLRADRSLPSLRCCFRPSIERGALDPSGRCNTIMVLV